MGVHTETRLLPNTCSADKDDHRPRRHVMNLKCSENAPFWRANVPSQKSLSEVLLWDGRRSTHCPHVNWLLPKRHPLRLQTKQGISSLPHELCLLHQRIDALLVLHQHSVDQISASLQGCRPAASQWRTLDEERHVPNSQDAFPIGRSGTETMTLDDIAPAAAFWVMRTQQRAVTAGGPAPGRAAPAGRSRSFRGRHGAGRA